MLILYRTVREKEGGGGNGGRGRVGRQSEGLGGERERERFLCIIIRGGSRTGRAAGMC